MLIVVRKGKIMPTSVFSYKNNEIYSQILSISYLLQTCENIVVCESIYIYIYIYKKVGYLIFMQHPMNGDKILQQHFRTSFETNTRGEEFELKF